MGESGVKKSEEMRLKSTIYESTLSTAARSPFPNGEGCDTRMPLYLKQSLPRVGKVASKASRIGFWRYEKERGRLSQVRDYTRAPERRPKRKPTPPRCAPCPFQGKGLGWTLPPSYGRRCPEGAEVGWGKRYEKERGEIVSSTSFARAPYPPLRGPPSPMGKAAIRGCRYPRNTAFSAWGR